MKEALLFIVLMENLSVWSIQTHYEKAKWLINLIVDY